jgi:hypothetical protein
MYVLMCVLCYLSLVAAIVFNYLPVACLSVLVTIPCFVWVWTGLKKFLETPVKLVPYIIVGAGAIYLACALVIVSIYLW